MALRILFIGPVDRPAAIPHCSHAHNSSNSKCRGEHSECASTNISDTQTTAPPFPEEIPGGFFWTMAIPDSLESLTKVDLILINPRS